MGGMGDDGVVLSAHRSEDGALGCFGCCVPMVRNQDESNHHCPRWRSHYQSDFAHFLSLVVGGRSPQRAAPPVVVQPRFRVREDTWAQVDACHLGVMGARSCAVLHIHSAAMGARSGFRFRPLGSTGYMGSQATDLSVGARLRSYPLEGLDHIVAHPDGPTSENSSSNRHESDRDRLLHIGST